MEWHYAGPVYVYVSPAYHPDESSSGLDDNSHVTEKRWAFSCWNRIGWAYMFDSENVYMMQSVHPPSKGHIITGNTVHHEHHHTCAVEELTGPSDAVIARQYCYGEHGARLFSQAGIAS